MVITFILFACFFFARRRRRRRKNLPHPDSLSSTQQLDMTHAPAGISSDITPFVVGDHTSGPFAEMAGGPSTSQGAFVRTLTVQVPGSSARRKENGRDGARDLPPEYQSFVQRNLQ